MNKFVTCYKCYDSKEYVYHFRSTADDPLAQVCDECKNVVITIEPTITPQYCDRCKRCMTTAHNTTIIGCTIALHTIDGMKQEIQHMYPEVELDRKYKLCWACWLQVLQLIPDKSHCIEDDV